MYTYTNFCFMSFFLINNNNNNNNLIAQQSIKSQDYQQTPGLISIDLQTEVNNHPTSLGIACGQHLPQPLLAF